ncbi:hypothetical protein C4579_00010 [Candidatus Microgenomates bacterium]|nr:MAG: hypothetical protein C4579_00010 [Candidatus Microgenomates bacterium]
MHITSSQVSNLPQQTARFILQKLTRYLSQNDTLLLLSGGSVGKEVVPELVKLFQNNPQSLENLIVGLIDERFGQAWHEQSNMLLLQKSGLLSFLESKHATFLPILTDEHDADWEAKRYENVLNTILEKVAGRSIGILGIGADGHTAGIKPQPDQATFDGIFMQANRLVVNYSGTDFERITLTPLALQKLTQIVVYAKGEEKREALEKLQNGKAEDVYKYPAILLQKHPRVELFSDNEKPAINELI